MSKQISPVLPVLCLIVGLAIGIVVYEIKSFSSLSSEVGVGTVSSSTFSRLPSVSDMQQMIRDRGYKIKVDGMLCGACYVAGHSETQENWDLAYNEQCNRETWPDK